MWPMHTELRNKQHKKEINYACWITMGIGYWPVDRISENNNNSGFRCTIKRSQIKIHQKEKKKKKEANAKETNEIKCFNCISSLSSTSF